MRSRSGRAALFIRTLVLMPLGLFTMSCESRVQAGFVAEFEVKLNAFSLIEAEMDVTLWRSGKRTRSDGRGRFWGMASPDSNLFERTHISNAGRSIQWHIDQLEKTYVEITDADLFREDSLYRAREEGSDLQAQIDSAGLLKPSLFQVTCDSSRAPETINGFPADPTVFILKFNPDHDLNIPSMGESQFELEFWMTAEIPVADEIAEMHAEWDAFAEKHHRYADRLPENSEMLQIGDWLQAEIRNQRGYPVRMRVVMVAVDEEFREGEKEELPPGITIDGETARFALCQIELLEIKRENIPDSVFELQEGLTKEPFRSWW